MDTDLIRIGELSRRTGVAVATLKYYVREGLLAPVRKSGKTMAWYSPTAVSRIATIKQLQEQQFMPLEQIKKNLPTEPKSPREHIVAETITGVLSNEAQRAPKTRGDLLDKGRVTPSELDWLAAAGLSTPDTDGQYRNDDLSLLATLGAARKAGLVADMLPFDVLGEYLCAIHRLVTAELALYRAGVIKRARQEDLESLTTAATELSERLVVLIRRKLLVPTMKRMIHEENQASAEPATPVEHAARETRRRARARPVVERAHRPKRIEPVAPRARRRGNRKKAST